MDVFSATRSAQQNISLRPGTTAVLIVDMLHDFCDPAGAMCLPGAERLYPIQNDLIQSARAVGHDDWLGCGRAPPGRQT